MLRILVWLVLQLAVEQLPSRLSNLLHPLNHIDAGQVHRVRQTRFLRRRVRDLLDYSSLRQETSLIYGIFGPIVFQKPCFVLLGVSHHNIGRLFALSPPRLLTLLQNSTAWLLLESIKLLGTLVRARTHKSRLPSRTAVHSRVTFESFGSGETVTEPVKGRGARMRWTPLSLQDPSASYPPPIACPSHVVTPYQHLIRTVSLLVAQLLAGVRHLCDAEPWSFLGRVPELEVGGSA